jgi:NH3-dependent NAD+ synthetase
MESYKTLDEIEESYTRNMRRKVRKEVPEEELKKIERNFKKNTCIKLPKVYIKGVQVQHAQLS